MQISLQDINQLEWLNATYGAAYYTSMHSIIVYNRYKTPLLATGVFYPAQLYKIQQSTNTATTHSECFTIDKIIDISTWQ